jgi:hypothetical protein
MANDIGNIRPINGHSTALNTQPFSGTAKPSCSGKESPGGSKPPKAPEGGVPMPK